MNKRPVISQPEIRMVRRSRVAVPNSPSGILVPLGTCLFVLLLVGLLPAPNEARVVSKRSFIDAECRGKYEPVFEKYFKWLERICYECYDLYKNVSIRKRCPKDCFRNAVMTDCMKALMLEKEKKQIYKMINTLAG